MTKKLTIKQEKYVQNRIAGMSQRQAYRGAYDAENMSDEAVDTNASKLESDAKVALRIEELKQQSARRAVRKRSDILKSYDKLIDISEDVLAKRHEQTGKVDYNASQALVSSLKTYLEYAPDDTETSEKPPFTADFGLLLAPDFLQVHRLLDAGGQYVDFWLGGGRGSMKSSCASLELVKHIETHQEQHGVVFMKYKNALRDGAYAQIVWAINALGLADDYNMPDSTLRITKKSTGQLILFRGVDNAKKIKSIKVPFGHIGIAWYEEADMFHGMAEIREVNQSVTRGGGTAVRLYTFNPPRSNRSWINEHVQSGLAGDAILFESNYLRAPAEWLGPQFIADAEHLKETDPQAYDHEYMGLPVGNGTEVFDRVEFREITDDEIRAFDNVLIGQDFGWYPDPWACVFSEWRQNGRELISFYELGGNKLQPKEQADLILEAFDHIENMTKKGGNASGLRLHRERVLSDDADPQAISAQKDAGVNAMPAGKGGLRAQSYRFIQSAKWVIDPVRCPNLAREVRAMQYEINKDGEILNNIPDGNDHWVDATRYSVMHNVKRARTAYRDR